MEKLTNRVKGSLAGLAIGDALGSTNENVWPGTVKNKVTDLVGGGWLYLNPGDVTDDTQMAHCIVKAGLDTINDEFLVDNIVDRFQEWKDSGPKDIGSTVSGSLNLIRQIGLEKAIIAQSKKHIKANGGLMRTMPISLFYNDNKETAWLSARVTTITHPSPLLVHLAATYNLMVSAYLGGKDVDLVSLLWSSLVESGELLFVPADKVQSVIAAIRDDIYDTPLAKLHTGIGYGAFIATMKIALMTDNVEDALLKAANLGGDCDTVGAILGGLVGAKYGFDSIPTRWWQQLGSEGKKFVDDGMKLYNKRRGG